MHAYLIRCLGFVNLIINCHMTSTWCFKVVVFFQAFAKQDSLYVGLVGRH